MTRFSLRARADDGAQADDAVVDVRAVDDAAVGNDGVVDLRAVDLGAGQIARTRKNRRAHVEEIETRQLGDQIQVGLEKRTDRADVFPIALKDIGERRGAYWMACGMMCLPKSESGLSSSSQMTLRLKT